MCRKITANYNGGTPLLSVNRAVSILLTVALCLQLAQVIALQLLWEKPPGITKREREFLLRVSVVSCWIVSWIMLALTVTLLR